MRMTESVRRLRKLGLIVVVLFSCFVVLAQTAPPPVTLKAEIVNPKAGKKSAPSGGEGDASNVVVWLVPVGVASGSASAPPPARPMPQIAQTNKSFDPHVLVIQVGTEVRFPTKIPFFTTYFRSSTASGLTLGFTRRVQARPCTSIAPESAFYSAIFIRK